VNVYMRETNEKRRKIISWWWGGLIGPRNTAQPKLRGVRRNPPVISLV